MGNLTVGSSGYLFGLVASPYFYLLPFISPLLLPFTLSISFSSSPSLFSSSSHLPPLPPSLPLLLSLSPLSLSISLRLSLLPTSPPSLLPSPSSLSPQGQLALNGNTEVKSMADKGKRMYCFEVTCGKTGVPFEICSDDQRSKHEWMLAIKKVSLLSVYG